MTQLQAVIPRRGDALLLLHAHHAAGLQRDLDRLGLEHGLAAHQADEAPRGVHHRVHRIVPVEDLLHRVPERHRRLQHERILDHHLRQREVVLAEEQIAHGDDAAQPALAVDHPDVGDEHALHPFAQRLDGFAHGPFRREGADHRLHHAADGVVSVERVALPLARHRVGRGAEQQLAQRIGQRGEHVLREGGRELHQRRGDFAGSELLELPRGSAGGPRADFLREVGGRVHASPR